MGSWEETLLRARFGLLSGASCTRFDPSPRVAPICTFKAQGVQPYFVSIIFHCSSLSKYGNSLR